MRINFFETSAKENLNVEQMFNCITELVLEAKLRSPQHQAAAASQGVRLDARQNRSRGQDRAKKCKCGHSSGCLFFLMYLF
ncbi:ras-related protein Rab-35 [Ditylenchus destructor]|uniref:Ras-related protein Rab-35 n=1 Tax=Ditylenchus destructor TaxID=166010 RepID=A0AAD4QUW5_9BILA|nr:ras-related protein Rab-35 [Ditylenchus destructor]